MEKDTCKNYRFFGNNCSKHAYIFVPGGPGIHGDYWDSFIEHSLMESSSDFAFYRMVLPNHEALYGTENNLTFDLASNLLGSRINLIDKFETVDIVAHSFGAWLLLDILRNGALSFKPRNVYLTGMPTELRFSENFQAKKAIINSSIVVNSDDSFLEYFKSISGLYFNSDLPQNSCLFKNVYWEKNSSMGMSNSRTLSSLLNYEYKEKFILINGERDTLLAHSDPRPHYKCIKNADLEIIPNSGHFTMLENPELFSYFIIKPH